MKVCIFLSLFLIACDSAKQDAPKDRDEVRKFSFGSLTGEDGISLGGSKKKSANQDLNVNIFLWRAALDTVNFAPIQVSDAIGGIISTEWYSLDNKNERLKVTVRVISKTLRADGVTVKVFKQVFVHNTWKDIDSSRQHDLEEIIVRRARELNLTQ